MTPIAIFGFQTEPTDLDTIVKSINTSGTDWWDFGRALIILVVAVATARLIRYVVKRIVNRTNLDGLLGDLVGRIAGYVVVSFGLVYSLGSLGIAVAPILGALGIVGIALAFALQDVLANFVAGILLQLRRPFSAGDEILSTDHEGTVLQVDARTVTIRTPDGETVRIPSAEVLKHPIVNHTQLGRRRTTVEVGVAYGTNLDRAAEVALKAASTTAGVLGWPAPEVVVHNFGDSSVDLAVRYWHAPSIAAQWSTRDLVARAIDRGFREGGIEIPFPQRVVHTTMSPAEAEPTRPSDQAAPNE